MRLRCCLCCLGRGLGTGRQKPLFFSELLQIDVFIDGIDALNWLLEF